MLDLVRINIDRMKKEGIGKEETSQVNLCTHYNNNLFFS
jgi:copper oxidase (laccase) domain-containing protein